MEVRKLHLILGLLIVPVAVMFLLTGSLYTFGVKGNYSTETHIIPTDTALRPDLNLLEPMVENILKEKGLATPTGKLSIKKAGTSWELEWTGSRMDVILAPTDQPDKANLILKKTSPHRFFVQLHKAKGGLPFKLLAAFFALSLLILAITGLIQASQMPKYKKLSLILLGSGILLFLLAAVFS